MDKIFDLPLAKVRVDGGTQSRAALNGEATARYQEMLDRLPPAVVYHDGSHYWLAAGFHRFFAHKEKKRRTIRCEVRTGTVRDAILFSTGENAEHGLPRTREDEEHVCRMLLQDEQWNQWSDSEIARIAKVGRHLVAKMRKLLKDEERKKKEKEKEAARFAQEKAEKERQTQLTNESEAIKSGWTRPGKPQSSLAAPASEPEPQTRTVRTKHGTTTKMNTSKIGRARDRQALAVETDPDTLSKLEVQIPRSFRKAIVQAIRRGWNKEAILTYAGDVYDQLMARKPAAAEN